MYVKIPTFEIFSNYTILKNRTDLSNTPVNGSWQCGHFNHPTDNKPNRCQNPSTNWFVHKIGFFGQTKAVHAQIAARCQEHVADLTNTFKMDEISEEQALNIFHTKQAIKLSEM